MSIYFQRLVGAWRSLTVWFNGIIGSILVTVPLLEPLLPQLQGLITPAQYKYIALALVVGNVLLRFKTTQALDQKGK